MNENHPVSELFSAAANGTEYAWKAIVDRYAPVVCAVAHAYRLEPSDVRIVGQLVWLRLAENLTVFGDAAGLRAWLVTATRQECLRVIARYGRAEPPAIGATLARIEQLQALRDGLAELAPEDRDLLMLVARDPAISADQLGRLLHVPADDAGPMLARGLARLRETPSVRTVSR